MGIEILGLFFVGIIFFVLIFFALRKSPRKELTAAERMSYESERGRLIAQQEFNGRQRNNSLGIRPFWE